MADEKDAMVEVRFMCPRAFVDVADAYGIANGKTRTDIGVQIFREFAEHWLHVSRVIQNVARANPALSDADRK